MRPFKKKKPVKSSGNYAFIDSQNLNLGTQKMGWKMDWKKFREWLKTEYNVDKAFMFIGYMPDHEKLYDESHSQLPKRVETGNKGEDGSGAGTPRWLRWPVLPQTQV